MELFNYKIRAAAYSARQFVFFRIVLGTYLMIHFMSLIPYAEEMFSNKGIFNKSELNFTYGVFPDILSVYDSPFQVRVFLSVMLLLSTLFLLGVLRRYVAFFLWYGWACLINRNNLIVNPGMPYIGWLLLMCVFIPNGEDAEAESGSSKWKLPAWTILGAWLIMAAGYTISGLDKLQSPSWTSGNTFSILLDNPLCRDTVLRDWSLHLPHWILKLITLTVLTAELLFLPMALFNVTRKYAWMMLTLMHLCILCYINFADLTIGMLMIHVFTFDPAWISPAALKFRPQLFFQFFKKSSSSVR